MLSYDDAVARILDSVPGPLPAETVPVAEALGRPLANDLFADSDVPPFDNSAVDGYAIDGAAPHGKNAKNTYRYAFTIPTGTPPPGPVPGGSYARIYTGAMVPEGADRIIMQEDVTERDFGEVYVNAPGRPGDFIRRRGSDIARETKILAAGQTIHPGVVGLLAALNQTTVSVPRIPLVALLTTGDEVVPPGRNPLRPGQIRDANGPALSAAIREAGGAIVTHRHVPDDPEATRAAFDACVGADIIVTSGGVSVGDRDFIKSIAEERGTLDFWRIAIRPGKPLACGQINGSLFFGLPGNPVSSLVTFELFVRPALRKLAGHRDLLRPQVNATLTAPLSHETGRREFARAHITWQNDRCLAAPTGAQGSHRLASLTDANALLIAHEDHADYAAGDTLPALLLF